MSPAAHWLRSQGTSATRLLSTICCSSLLRSSPDQACCLKPRLFLSGAYVWLFPLRVRVDVGGIVVEPWVVPVRWPSPEWAPAKSPAITPSPTEAPAAATPTAPSPSPTAAPASTPSPAAPCGIASHEAGVVERIAGDSTARGGGCRSARPGCSAEGMEIPVCDPGIGGHA